MGNETDEEIEKDITDLMGEVNKRSEQVARENARYMWDVRQRMPQELADMATGWLRQFAEYANRTQLEPPMAACAVATLMAMVVQTHVDAAGAHNGTSYDTAINQMLDCLDTAARVELGVISFQRSKETRN